MDKQLKNIMILLLVVLPTIVVLLFAMKAYWLAWVSVCDGFLTCGSESRTEITLHDEIKWEQKPEIKPLEAPKKKEPVKVPPKVEKKQEPIKEVKIDPCNDIQCSEEYKKKSITLSDKIQVVACLNEKNMTIHSPKNWNCYLGQGGKWKNILLPPKSHIEHFKKIFWDDYKYRLAIANFEGSFNENAQNPYAIWYLQTLRTHKVKKDVVSQLTWLKNREDKNTGVACEKYSKENFTLFGTINIEKGELAKYTCMARRHYGAFSPWDGKHWHHSVMYAKRFKVTTEYYLSIGF